MNQLARLWLGLAALLVLLAGNSVLIAVLAVAAARLR